jgi:hypothetical protein
MGKVNFRVVLNYRGLRHMLIYAFRFVSGVLRLCSSTLNPVPRASRAGPIHYRNLIHLGLGQLSRVVFRISHMAIRFKNPFNHSEVTMQTSATKEYMIGQETTKRFGDCWTIGVGEIVRTIANIFTFPHNTQR